MKISACLIVFNEEKNLERCLSSIIPVVDEIVVIDSGSTDRTVEIARSFGARVVPQAWLGYVGQKNFALAQAQHPWVLSIDADEELSGELAQAILRLKADPGVESANAPNGYEISRVVFYRGKWIRHGDWYPDRLVRLFRRETARFTGGRVHEKLEIAGPHPLLPGELHHYTYADATDRAGRCARYASLWAESAREQGRRVYPGMGPLRAAFRFLRGFVLKGGFLDGAVGYEIALGNAREVRFKYRLLAELNSQARSQ
jgi:glycosyltransferase involved in cell wall biosynthesis